MKVIGENAIAKIRSFRDQLYQLGYGNFMTVNQYRNGHYILKSEKMSIYVIYKRDWFKTFSKQYKDFIDSNPEFSGVGESINRESLNIAIQKGCSHIVFIHDDEVYTAPAWQIFRFCEKYGLKRIQKRKNTYRGFGNTRDVVVEITYSFPKILLKTFKDEFCSEKQERLK